MRERRGDGDVDGCHGAVTHGFAGKIIAVLDGLVADKAEDPSCNVGNDQFVGLCFDKSSAGLRNVGNERIDILPFRAGNDL